MQIENEKIVGAVIQFSGIVQGVGFRPFVYKTAHYFAVKGFVKNTDNGVYIEIDGSAGQIRNFYESILQNMPPLAEIHQSSFSFCKEFGFSDFSIQKSSDTKESFCPVSPDIGICDDCLKEIFDPADRRLGYPFTNCTNCGPRFTIVQSIPYDRKNTTMSIFPMCPDCLKEYENPLDRRYHAQPNACPLCGPSLKLYLPDGTEVLGDPVDNAIKILQQSKILAVKGIGGYHLAADPCKKEAVEMLRQRKRRQGKPFALMAKDLDVIKKYCIVGPQEEKLICSVARPIVLLSKQKQDSYLYAGVSPDTPTLGVMLPYTPLHHLILRKGPEILIMTSANLSEEPLVFQDEDCFQRLGTIADAFLMHNRKIERPCDDSVFTFAHNVPVPVRRSRGYTPKAIEINGPKKEIIAFGASEKNTFCILKEGRAFVSHHIGDLNNVGSFDAFMKGIEDFLAIFRSKPQLVACDAHPDYMSTRAAQKFSEDFRLPLVYVQHHHAHIASVLAEKKIQEDVIGVALDGTGYGLDGNIWGGEFLIANTQKFQREGHYAYVPMPGGEKSILEIDRMAISYLFFAYGSSDAIPSFEFIEQLEEQRFSAISRMLKSNINCPLASSCGRLFDAVSAILGLCSRPAYEAQGAVLLETAACGSTSEESVYSYEISQERIIDYSPMIREIVRDFRHGISKSSIAQKFHGTIVSSAAQMCEILRKEHRINTVVLSGGVFQNRIILENLIEKLKKRNFIVEHNSLVPPNDGGISLGQAIIASRHVDR